MSFKMRLTERIQDYTLLLRCIFIDGLWEGWKADRQEEIKTDKASLLAALEFQRNTLQKRFNSRYAMIQISKIKT
ncbi:hypothetical protein [uncultured Paraglaciecola sp.]|uniref:hypothetical protein n=1 Tax=uncultured Paraglaciecola sp. TaxID=1765024 RepID=UPI0025CC15D7|nr:hypothetical protein [uncultured Paraglaciecola sp.]